jgi:hypothetical protein
MDFGMNGQVMVISLSNLLEEKQRESNAEQLMGVFLNSEEALDKVKPYWSNDK